MTTAVTAKVAIAGKSVVSKRNVAAAPSKRGQLVRARSFIFLLAFSARCRRGAILFLAAVVSFRRRFSRTLCFALLRGTSAHISARTSFVDAFLSRKSPFRGRVRARGCVFRAQGSLSINLSLFSLFGGEREKKGRFLKERVGGKRLLPDDDGRFERRAFT